MADDDIAVTIEEEAPEKDTETVVKDPVEEVGSQFKEMQARAQRAEEERAAALRRANAAEIRAQQAQREATAAKTEVIEGQSETIDSGISAATDAIESAKKEIRTAGEAGDHQAQADAYDRLAAARARLERLNEAKADILTKKVEAPKQTQEPEPVGDQFEAYVSRFTEPTARWMRDHKEWVTDSKKSLKLTAAHNDALSEGLEPDTAGYFSHVEKFIGLKKDEPEKPAPKTPAKRAPVAPVQNGSNGYSGGTEVRLSKKQAEAATDGTHVWNYDDQSGQKRFKKGDPIGIQEMARRVKAMTEQGLFRPENTEI